MTLENMRSMCVRGFEDVWYEEGHMMTIEERAAKADRDARLAKMILAEEAAKSKDRLWQEVHDLLSR